MQSQVYNQQEHSGLDLWGNTIIINLVDLHLIKFFLQVAISVNSQEVFYKLLDSDGKEIKIKYGAVNQYKSSIEGQNAVMKYRWYDSPTVITYGPYDNETKLYLHFTHNNSATKWSEIVKLEMQEGCLPLHSFSFISQVLTLLYQMADDDETTSVSIVKKPFLFQHIF